jgi:hypothetical protein
MAPSPSIFARRCLLRASLLSLLLVLVSVATSKAGELSRNNLRRRSPIHKSNTSTAGGVAAGNNNDGIGSSAGQATSIQEMCNLCHSLANEAPYPLPELENRTVTMNGRWGTPEELGSTCLEVWNHVLDFGTGGGGTGDGEYHYDMATCRMMGREYAPQCCNSRADLPMLLSSDPAARPLLPPNHGGSRNMVLRHRK